MMPYYEQDGITIYHGDCRDVFPSLGNRSVDLLLTDPPYASGARRDSEKSTRGSMLREFEDADWFSHDAMTTWGFSWFLRSVLTDLRPVLTIGAHMYIFSDWRQTPSVYGMTEATGYRVNHCLVWDKSHFGMGTYWRNQHENIIFASNGMPAPMLNRGMGSVLKCPGVPSRQRVHPTEKPSLLMRKMIQAVPGDVILDPFCGSGPTLRAAKDLGRKAIGIDIDERNCETAAKGLQQGVLPLEVLS